MFFQVSRPSSVPGKVEYPPPPAHSRTSKSSSSSSRHDKSSPSIQHQVIPKAEPNVSLFSYSGYPPPSSASYEQLKSKSSSGRTDRDHHRVVDVLPNPPPLLSDHKSSVIVKNEGGNSKQPVAVPAHSPSPKLMYHMQPVSLSTAF